MEHTITPEKQSVEACLKNKSYCIDFYQREYVWQKETVATLLNDIFYFFDLDYGRYKNNELNQETIDKFNWYYLNTFVTNKVNSATYIVDGQQRLTTLTLIATKLYHMIKANNENLKSLLQICIFSNDGFEYKFNLDHEKRANIMGCIFDNEPYPDPKTYKNKTEETLIERYKDISNSIDAKFKNENTDSKKLEFFILYFLKRLVLVELATNKDDTPMIFEAINDRGEALKPFEILKGKLIGMLNKGDTDTFCSKWDEAISELLLLEGKDKSYPDHFFFDFFRAHFIFTRNSAIEQRINNEYHKYIFENNDIAQKLGFRKQDDNYIQNIKDFIEQNIHYYPKLYKKIISNKNEFLTYINSINYLNGVYQNILATCKINDLQEDEKIHTIAKEYDRLYVLLRLNDIYDSNHFQEITYNLNKELLKTREQEFSQKLYREIFNNQLKKTFEKNSIPAPQPLLREIDFLKIDSRKLNSTFRRYILARVEKYICNQINQNPQCEVYDLSTKTRGEGAYHIEHILSDNNTNLTYFKDEEEFEEYRNKLGGLLLLKSNANQSSKNEEYQNKLETYSASLVWNHSLCEDFYHTTNRDFLEFNQRVFGDKEIKFKPYDKFDKQALEERTKLLYELVKIIWEVE